MARFSCKWFCTFCLKLASLVAKPIENYDGSNLVIQYCPFVGLMSKLLSNKRHCKLGTAIGNMHHARDVQSPRTLCSSGNIWQQYNHLLFLWMWNSSLNRASLKNAPFPHITHILTMLCKEDVYTLPIFSMLTQSSSPVSASNSCKANNKWAIAAYGWHH